MYIIGNTIKSASEFEVYFLTKAQTKFSLSEKRSLVGSFEGVCASGSVGGVRPCQGRGRGFESRLALFFYFRSLVFTRLFVLQRT